MRALLIMVFSMVLISCASYERCVDKFGDLPPDTLLIEHVVEIPRDSIIHTLQIDSIEMLLPGDTILIESPESRAKIKYWRNQYESTLGMMAICDTVIIRDTIKVNMPVILQPPPPGKIERIWLTWSQAAGIVVPLLLLILLLYKKLIK